MQKKSKNTYFTIFLISILSGIGLWNFLWDLYLWSIILALFFLILWIISRHYRQIISCIIFVFSGCIIGLFASLYSLHHIDTNIDILDEYVGLYNNYSGEVYELHSRKDFHDEYVIVLQSIADNVMDRNIRHIVRLPKNFTLYPGQEISYSWVMYSIEDFDGFAYKKFMLSKNIYFSTSISTLITLRDHRQWFRYNMYNLREKLLSRIEQIFPKQEAIFLWGILFGARENIPQELKEDFNNSWLTHFIAVSWFNITLCIIFISFIFWFLPLFPRMFMVCASIIWFSIFVWLWAPVVRAAIMWILWYIFLQSWNTSKWVTLLSFTWVAMTLMNPLALSYDVSLHLSFLAVIGIMYTQEMFQWLFSWVPSTLAIREAFVLTLSALSFSLPIMMFQFWQISLLAPLANIAVTWTIPLAMLLWALTLVVDITLPFLTQAMWFIAWVFLKYDMYMVWFFWNIDAALFRMDFWTYSYYLQALYFIFLTYWLTLYHQKKKKQF